MSTHLKSKNASKGTDPKKDRPKDWLAKRKKASALRQSVAHESKAASIIGHMLEDAAYGSQDEFEQRPGGAQDPWRKALGPLPPMKVGGRGLRAGSPEEDEEDETEDAPSLSAPSTTAPAMIAPAKKPNLGKHGGRFSWTPTSESVRRVLGRSGMPSKISGEELDTRRLARGDYA